MDDRSTSDPAAGTKAHLGPDWDAIAQSPEFQKLLSSRLRFVAIGTTLIVAYVTGLLCLLAFAPHAMATPVIGEISWALCLAISVIIVTFAAAYLFARRSRVWNQMRQDVQQASVDGISGDRSGR